MRSKADWKNPITRFAGEFPCNSPLLDINLLACFSGNNGLTGTLVGPSASSFLA